MQILDVKIDEVNLAMARARAADFLVSEKSHTIFTPNPEMIVDAARDSVFTKILNLSDLNLCDGFGLKLVAPRLTRVPGADFMRELCALAAAQNKSVYLLGSADADVLKKTATALQQKFPTLKISGIDPGYPIALAAGDEGRILTYNQTAHDECLQRIIMAAPAVLLVAFGHPKQEKWIAANLPHLPSVKIAMGVGGAFDYLSGKATRAPKSVQSLGLEWLWRLAHEPRRFKRIWKATVVFLFYILFKK